MLVLFSQYDTHIRGLCNWPMPTIQLLSEAVTVNVLEMKPMKRWTLLMNKLNANNCCLEAVTVNVLGNEAYETMDIINEHQIGISTIMATVKQKRNERWGILLY